MEKSRVIALIEHNAKNRVIIAPKNRIEWTKYCWALKTLGMDKSYFVAVSYKTKEAEQKWNSENNFKLTESEAIALVIALSREAGVNVSRFMKHAKQRPYSPSLEEEFGHIAEVLAPPQPSVYIPMTDVNSLRDNVQQSALYNYLCSLFPADSVDEAFTMYRVGATAEFRDKAPNLASAFPYINADGQCVDVHLMAYSPDGHRRKQGYNQNWLMAKRKQGDRRAKWPLFGEHLLCSPLVSPAAPVGIVESEKTALIAFVAMPDVLWMATQSLVNLKADRLLAVKDKPVYVFPDADGLEQWETAAKKLLANGFNVSFCGDYITRHAEEPKDDLGDIICRYYQTIKTI